MSVMLVCLHIFGSMVSTSVTQSKVTALETLPKAALGSFLSTCVSNIVLFFTYANKEVKTLETPLHQHKRPPQSRATEPALRTGSAHTHLKKPQGLQGSQVFPIFLLICSFILYVCCEMRHTSRISSVTLRHKSLRV